MIQKINLKNFQSHKNSTLEFDKGMNVIIGASDSGKSAIIRALRKLIWNKPSGDSFRSYWGGDSKIKMNLEDSEIIRTNTNSENSYYLDPSEGDGILFKAFNKDVPEEISSELRMNDINLQEQLNSHFLISETSGNVAAHFNKIAKLDKIDSGLLKIQNGVKDKKTGKVIFTGINILKSDINYTEKEIVEKKKQLKKFVDLEKFEDDLLIIEDLEAVQLRMERTINELTSAAFSYERLISEIETKSKVLLMENSINIILELYENKRQSKQDYKTIKKLSLKVSHSQETIKEAEKEVLAESSINEILEIYQNYKKAQLSWAQLTQLSSTIQLIKNTQETTSKQLKKLEEEYERDFPDVCPLCNTKIK